MKSVKAYLCNNFSMKDISEASYILCIMLYRDRVRKLIRLPQSTYIDKMLEMYGFTNSKATNVPFRYDIYLSKKMTPQTQEDRVRMYNLPYASCIGSILYVMY